jgi:hypothetical protein
VALQRLADPAIALGLLIDAEKQTRSGRSMSELGTDCLFAAVCYLKVHRPFCGAAPQACC